MHLTDKGLQDTGAWEKAGITLPRFDRAAMIAETKAAPHWVHFGAGNIFRAFPAALHQKLLEAGLEKTGIIAAEGYDGEIIDKGFAPFDNLSLLVTLKADGNIGKQVIGSVADALSMDTAEAFERLKSIFCKTSLQMASFTITEKGYSIKGADGLLPHILKDIEAGCAAPASYLGRITALCHERYAHGGHPLAMVSMDNCSGNGDKLFAAVEAIASGWVEKGHADKGFLDYVRNPEKLSFPCSMIDKITPRPDDGVKDMLASIGFEDTQTFVTGKGTYSASFINAEETQYLVIEDRFPNGRPPLEKAGVYFTNRDTVDKVEKMKVCTCLNPLHTALAVFGCLLGYTKISDELKDADLVKLIKGIGYVEGLPVVVDPLIIKPQEFIDTVVNVRLPNPFMPDTPQRIAADTSLKLPIRFGETLKSYKERGLDIAGLKCIPLVFAGWLRYVLGIDDEGKPFTVTPDPQLDSLKAALSGIKIGDTGAFHDKLQPILSNKEIFALNLYEIGLGEVVESSFAQMIAAPGAVRKILHSVVG